MSNQLDTEFSGHGYGFLRRAINNRGERGNTLIMYIVLMPVMIMLLAYGISTALNNYTRSTLQSALDQATQSAVGQAVNGDGVQQTIRLSNDLLTQTNRLYDLNRTEKLANLLCNNSLTPASEGANINPASGCPWRQISSRIYTKNGSQYFEVKVHDYSKVIFGSILDQGYQTYTIVSTARITGTTGI